MTDQAYTENRLYLVNRNGQGEAYFLLLNSDLTGFESHVLHAEKWPPCTDVTDFGIAAVEDMIYIIGGYDQKARKCMKRVLRYSPCDGTWVDRAPLFLSRSNMAVSVVNGQIYISGGEKTDGKTTGTCELYDPQTDTWAKNGSLRASRASHVTVAVGSEIYCSGGRQGEEGRNNLWVYEGKKWEELDRHYPQKMDVSISGHVMAEMDNKLYIAGGIQHDVDEAGVSRKVTSGRTVAFNVSVPRLEVSDDIQILSPWNRDLPSLIYPRHNAGSVVLGGRLYVFGGSKTEDGEEVKAAEYFDVRQQKWCHSFKFKKGKLGNVQCAVVRVTTQPDKPDSPSDFKWVLW